MHVNRMMTLSANDVFLYLLLALINSSSVHDHVSPSVTHQIIRSPIISFGVDGE